MKLAESKSADSERGGRPCLDDGISDVSEVNQERLLPDEICERQWVKWF